MVIVTTIAQEAKTAVQEPQQRKTATIAGRPVFSNAKTGRRHATTAEIVEPLPGPAHNGVMQYAMADNKHVVPKGTGAIVPAAAIMFSTGIVEIVVRHKIVRQDETATPRKIAKHGKTVNGSGTITGVLNVTARHDKTAVGIVIVIAAFSGTVRPAKIAAGNETVIAV